jgi:hypothetical protein
MSDLLTFIEGMGLALIVKGEVYKFTTTVFGNSAEEISKLVNNEIKCFNAQRTAQAFLKSYEKLKKAGIEPQKVKYKNLIPLLEGISIEDEETLQAKWDNLLTAAIAKGEIHPSYPSILRDLNSLDAKVLETIGELNNSKPFGKVSEFYLFLELSESLGFGTKVINLYKSNSINLSTEEVEEIKEGKEIIAESIDNLERVNLIEGKGERRSGLTMEGTLTLGTWGYEKIELSASGKRFFKAVSEPCNSQS